MTTGISMIATSVGLLAILNHFVAGRSYGSNSATTGSPGGGRPVNNGCLPNIIDKPVAADPMKRLGHYYEYAVKYQDDVVYNNEFDNILAGNGTVYLPDSNIPALHFTQVFRWITLSNGQPQCHYNWIDILSRNEGQDYYELFDPSFGNAQPRPTVIYLLYEKADDRGFEIQYQCDQQNRKTGICEKIEIFVNSRLHPDQMTAEERINIDATIDRVLKPYCLSEKDLAKVVFRTDLNLDDTCNLAPPEAFTNLVAGYQAALPPRQV